MEVIINGVAVQADLLKPKIAKLFEDSIDACLIEIKKSEKQAKGSKGLEMQCEAVKELVGNIFGTDAKLSIFGEDPDLLLCLGVFEEMYHLYERQVNPRISEKMAMFSSARALRK